MPGIHQKTENIIDLVSIYKNYTEPIMVNRIPQANMKDKTSVQRSTYKLQHERYMSYGRFQKLKK